MSLFIETHIIQNFAPCNLNRDDTGAPKDAIFGGFRRARISSQCLKKSVRDMARRDALVPAANMGLRTKKLAANITEALPQHRISDDEAKQEALLRVERGLASVGIVLDDKGLSQYLIFLGRKEVEQLAAVVDTHWDVLLPAKEEGGKEKKGKKGAKDAFPKEVQVHMRKALDGGKAVDVALFGRMLADLPDANADAACQVAHAISTHKVDREFDYFTAMDDLATAEETGAAMIETTEFNSACLYRYAAIDLAKLRSNLGGDEELVRAGLAAFVKASVLAVPTGKQNAFAAHNPPEFVGLALRNGAPRSLANAFQSPIWPRKDASLSMLSAAALAQYESKLSAAYGGSAWGWFDLTGGCPDTLGQKTESLSTLVDWLLAQKL